MPLIMPPGAFEEFEVFLNKEPHLLSIGGLWKEGRKDL